MDITIGIKGGGSSIDAEVDITEAQLRAQLESAIANPNTLLSFTDTRERVILVPGNSVAYITVNTNQPRRVGFNI